jgi:hypothetical protein
MPLMRRSLALNEAEEVGAGAVTLDGDEVVILEAAVDDIVAYDETDGLGVIAMRLHQLRRLRHMNRFMATAMNRLDESIHFNESSWHESIHGNSCQSG